MIKQKKHIKMLFVNPKGGDAYALIGLFYEIREDYNTSLYFYEKALALPIENYEKKSFVIWQKIGVNH